MCTIHANSAREAITKMCTLPLLAGENIGSHVVMPTMAGVEWASTAEQRVGR
jgi:pilus assembly protein CpaF